MLFHCLEYFGVPFKRSLCRLATFYVALLIFHWQDPLIAEFSPGNARGEGIVVARMSRSLKTAL